MKTSCADRINNKLIKHLKPGLIKFLHFSFNLCIYFDIYPTNWKIAKVIMLLPAPVNFWRRLQQIT